MVPQQAPHSTNKNKLSSSFENSSREQVDLNMPSNDFAIMYIDQAGKLMFEGSPSLQGYISTVFTPEVKANFLTAVDKSWGSREPVFSIKRRRKNTSIAQGDDASSCVNKTLSLRIEETQKIKEYYVSALEYFQQKNCRIIAKDFIKFIEPRKQVKHPYNGNKPPKGSAPGIIGDPERTKPEWWPPGVPHKEPDHLMKKDRIPLLLHIICNLKSRGITATKLREVAQETERRLDPRSHINVILEILNVRKMEEKYEARDINGDSPLLVSTYESSPKGDDDERPTDTPDVTQSSTRKMRKDFSTISGSIEQPTAAMTSISTLGMPNCSSMGNYTPLIFEPQDGSRFYATTQYTDLSSTQTADEPDITTKLPISGYQTQIPGPMSVFNQQPDVTVSSKHFWSISPLQHSTASYSIPPSPKLLSQCSVPSGLSAESSIHLNPMGSHGQSSAYFQSSVDAACSPRYHHYSSGVACTLCCP